MTTDTAAKQAKRDARIAAQLSHVKSKRDELPTDLGEDLHRIVYAPVVAIFGNRKQSDPKALNAAGFKTYHMQDRVLKDYPIIANQAIFMVDMDKLQKAHQDSSMEKRRVNHSENIKEWEDQIASHKKKEEARLKAIEDFEVAQEKYVKQIQEYKEYKVAEKAYLEKAQNKVSKFSVIGKPMPVAEPVKPTVLPDSFYEPILEPKKPSAGKRKFDVNHEELTEVVVAITEDLRELGIDYTLMSVTGKKNPRNPSLLCFWLAETWKYKKLGTLGNRVSLNSWNFAFE